jgi:hypothetical protein
VGVWYLTIIASDERQVPFPSEELRRAAVRVLARAAGREAALFCVVDDHLHVVLLCGPERIGWLRRALLLGLRPVAAAPLEPARARPVETLAHLESLVGHVLSQPVHHGLTRHPALWTGSCFQDLVGARWLPALQLRLGEALPRLTRGALLDAVGLRGWESAPSDDATLRGGGAARLVAAVATALALPPALGGNGAPVVSARRAVVQLGVGCGLTSGDLAVALGITPHAVRRLLTPTAPDELLRAARLRHAMVERLAGGPELLGR